MRCSGGLIALLVLAFVPSELPAQVVISPYVPGYYRSGVGVEYRSRRLAVSAYLSRGSYYDGGYYFPYYSYPSITRVYLYNPSPTYVVPPPIVIVPPAVAPAVEEPIDEGRFLRIEPRKRKPAEEVLEKRQPAEEVPEIREEPPLPGVPAGKFRPIDPKERERARRPVIPPLAVKEPEGECAQLIALGKEAFQAQEHGLAERRFQQAVLADPKDPLAHFLLAQARFALGKYPEAVEAIHAGMRLKPDWPAGRFPPKNLYQDNLADFQKHLERLEETVTRHPNDPVLLFLNAYQLWFTDRQAEARRLFFRASQFAPDKTFIDRFLKPGQPVAGK